MTSRLQSSGITALSFAVSAGLLAVALTPATANAAATGTNLVELTAPAERITESRRVDASDLDLTSASGLKKLDNRIRHAIDRVCREQGESHVRLDRDCDAEARRGAAQQIAALRSSARMLAAANAAGKVESSRVASR